MKTGTIGYFIIASAIIWGAVIMGCALKLKGTECYQSIDLILFGGMIAHLLFIWGPLVTNFSQKKKGEEKAD